MRNTFFTILLFLVGLSAAAQAPKRIAPQDLEKIKETEAAEPLETAEAPRRAKTDMGVKKIIPRIPVIMVEFTDFPFHRTKAQVDSLFNAQNYNEVFPHATAKGSIRRYFQDQSMGQYNPQFDIYGPVRVNHNCCDNFASYSNVRTMTKEACQIADSLIDFTRYDANGDGVIDLVYIYYAGFGRSDLEYIGDGLVSNKNQLIWPHWSTTGGASFDGKQIRDYECANELDGYWTQDLTTVYPAGIGVAVHEFCHALGLPDLYSTGNNSALFKHLGSYDVMDYGCYNDELFCPPSLSAYERWFLGWLNPTLLNSPQQATLDYIGTANQAYLITADGENINGPHATTTPYILLENRQKTKWDSAIPGQGLMVTQITYNASIWNSNTVNSAANQQHVKLISADDDYSISGTNWYGKPTDLFPAGATEYTAINGYPITNITENNGQISFLFMGGPTPTASTGLQTTDGCRKVMRNGEVVILRNGKIYNMLGICIDEQ